MQAKFCRQEFLRATSGSITVVAALAMVCMLGAVGLAVDFSEYLSMRRKTLSALDSAVLAASGGSVSDENRQKLFSDVFAVNYGTRYAPPKALRFSYSGADGGKGEAEITRNMTLLRALGITQVSSTLTSKAKTDALNLEIVFVLDISGSMNAMDMGGGTRLQALKASVTKLMDTISAAKTSAQSVKYGLVPFNMAVNVGTQHASIVAGTNHTLFNGTTWAGCVLERPNGYHAKDTYSSSASNGSGKWPAYIWPPEPNQGGYCLNPSNGTNTGYRTVEAAPLGKDPWMMGPNFNCPRFPLQRLTDSDSQVRTALQDLVAYGNMGTVVGPAVGWGLRLLSPTGPFGDGAQFAGSTRKILIVVTDGEMVTDGSSCGPATNSSDPYSFDPKSIGLQGRTVTAAPADNSFTPYGYLLDSDPYNKGIYTRLDADKELDRLSIDACDEVKARYSGAGAVEIFTIAASTGAAPGTRAETVLSKCASKSGNFIYAADAASLDAAFGKIAEQALGLRLTQ